jgi:hypothetical protein
MNKIFTKSINDKLIVNLTFRTLKGSIEKRRCVPYYFGPNTRTNSKDKSQRYHFLVLKGPEKSHPLILLPKQVLKIELTEVHFNPMSYIKWKPKWFAKTLWNVV